MLAPNCDANTARRGSESPNLRLARRLTLTFPDYYYYYYYYYYYCYYYTNVMDYSAAITQLRGHFTKIWI